MNHSIAMTSCYFLLNFVNFMRAQHTTTRLPLRALAIFFWILSTLELGQRTCMSTDTALLFSFEFCLKLTGCGWHGTRCLRCRGLLFSFEFCKAVVFDDAGLHLSKYPCYFLLNFVLFYACTPVHDHSVVLLFSFEFCDRVYDWQGAGQEERVLLFSFEFCCLERYVARLLKPQLDLAIFFWILW